MLKSFKPPHHTPALHVSTASLVPMGVLFIPHFIMHGRAADEQRRPRRMDCVYVSIECVSCAARLAWTAVREYNNC